MWAGQLSGAAHNASIMRVYPRVGGATRMNMSRTSLFFGLSPRGRGNLRALGCWR